MLHKYTNMDHRQDHHASGVANKVRDEIIPLKNCNSESDMWQAQNITKYCPDFRKDDFIYGDYYSEKFTWYRLVIHQCDKEKREAKGKTCKPQDEVDKYFRKNIVGIDVSSLKPVLTDFDKEIPLFEKKMDLRYSVKPDEGLTMCQTVFL